MRNIGKNLPLIVSALIVSFTIAVLTASIATNHPFDIIFVEDTSASAIADKRFDDFRDSLCKVIFPNGLNSNQNSFIHIFYAESVNTTGQWSSQRKCPLEKPDKLSTEKGTDPASAIDRALQMLADRPKNTKPLVLFSIHADENHEDAEGRNKLLQSVQKLISNIKEKNGKIIIFAGYYEKLRDYLEKEIKDKGSIFYCPYGKLENQGMSCSADELIAG